MDFEKLKEILNSERLAVNELNYLFNSLKNSENRQEKEILNTQIESLIRYFQKENKNSADILNGIYLGKPLKEKEIPQATIQPAKEKKISLEKLPKGYKIIGVEKDVIKRLKKKEEKVKKEKIRKPSKYVNIANKLFQNTSKRLLQENVFSSIEKNLVKTNIELIPSSYVSVMLFSTVVAFAVSFFIFLFFMVFTIHNFPLLSLSTDPILTRLSKIIWIMIIIPLATFFFMYFYPSMERKSMESKINQELPFATIHMATIAGASVEPSKIFSIIIATHEYTALQKEFTKLINFINIYGYDLVNSLRKVASASPSKKLSDLFNSLAVTITSGGDLADFFNKRSQSLLFDYRLEREKYIKFSETFMDIYISVVIASPMMLMLLLMIMKISGIGISLSSGMISLVMVLGVSIINVVFLVFLHLKQQKEGA